MVYFSLYAWKNTAKCFYKARNRNPYVTFGLAKTYLL